MAIKLIRGDTNRLNLYIRRQQLDEDGDPIRGADGNYTYTPVNLTNATLTLTASNSKTGTEVFQLDNGGGGQITVNNPPSSGNAVAVIGPTVTEDMDVPLWLDYDLELIESDTTKTTVKKDRFVVVSDVTVPAVP